MFLSAVQPYIVTIVIAGVVLQFAFALFCLLKLAYLDIDKKRYILWNVCILLVVFIGSAIFLVYYYKHPQLKLTDAPTEKTEAVEQSEQADEQPEAAQPPEPTEQTENAHMPNAESTQGEESGEQSGDNSEQTE